jgi:threonine/homoserine/homoserine lactone efflux protein
MTTDQAIAFFLFAVVAAATPGPSNIILTAVGANAGILKGLPSLLGVTVGMGLMMFLVPLGLGSLVLQIPLVLTVLHWGGAAFLLWLSWKIATSSRIESLPEKAPVGFVGAAAFQWVNPKSWLVTVSAAGTFLNAEGTSFLMQAVFLSGLFVFAALPSCFLWLAFGATIQRILYNERRLKVFNVTIGALLALSIALIVR